MIFSQRENLREMKHLAFSCENYSDEIIRKMVDLVKHDTSLVMRKLAFRICENKGADQLCGDCTADQPFFFSK